MSSSTGSTVPVLSERTDVHKSCKSLETVVNLLNDYCEAATAIVTLQKKLSKALRDAAATKCNPDIASNALNASAAIFEALADVHGKFAKIADKECDGLSAEVKRWFKKLAKEERAHDERITTANTRIKQAGQSYEKKVKKNARDAAEEHSRYIILLSALGPEMSQEKYNHTLFVTQRHISATCSVAACLARVADAEWLRHCEVVRRFAPTIGRLGEWKSLCEGGWTGPLPPNLPNVDAIPPRTDATTPLPTVDEERPTDPAELSDVGPDRRRAQDPHRESLQQQARPPSDLPPPPKAPVKFLSTDDASDVSKGSDDRKISLPSLDHFPSPPTHFPIPPVSSGPPSPSGPMQEDSSVHARQPSLASQSRKLPLRGASMESPPALSRVDSSPTVSRENPMIPPPISRSTSDTRPVLEEQNPGVDSPSTGETDQNASGETRASNRPLPTPGPSQPDKMHYNEQEFGVQKSRSPIRAQTMDSTTPKDVERIESTRSSGGSVVAAMRSRYVQNPTGTPQSPTREVSNSVRLPVSVSDIASRYQSITHSTPYSPQAASSSSDDRRRGSVDANPRMLEPYTNDLGSSTNSSRYSGTTASTSPNGDEIALRRKRIEELEELEIRERAHELRMKERENEQKARELDRERARLTARSIIPDPTIAADSPRGPTNQLSMSSVQRPPVYDSPIATMRSRYSYSTTSLVPPPGGSQPQPGRSQSRPVSPVSPLLNSSAESNPYIRSPAYMVRPRADKPKGWIRRLSMPVISSFDSSKKPALGVSSQPWRKSLQEENEPFRRPGLDRDSTGGISSSNRTIANYRR